jgi:hypothetical protein
MISGCLVLSQTMKGIIRKVLTHAQFLSAFHYSFPLIKQMSFLFTLLNFGLSRFHLDIALCGQYPTTHITSLGDSARYPAEAVTQLFASWYPTQLRGESVDGCSSPQW